MAKQLHEKLFSSIENLFGKSTNLLILGPPSSGKTSMVMALYRAFTIEQRIADEITSRAKTKIEFLPKNDITKDLLSRTSDVIATGKNNIAATDKLQGGYESEKAAREANAAINDKTAYAFKLQITAPSLLKFINSSYEQHFVIPDAPGYMLFPVGLAKQDINQNWRTMHPFLKATKIVVLCIDLMDKESTLSYYKFIQKLHMEEDLQFDAIIFMATKCDRRFPHLRDCVTASVCDEVTKVIGRDQVPTLKKKCKRLLAGWASFYGYRPDGTANYKEENQTLATCIENGCPPDEAVKAWEPFGLVEPILYAAAPNESELKEFP